MFVISDPRIWEYNWCWSIMNYPHGSRPGCVLWPAKVQLKVIQPIRFWFMMTWTFDRISCVTARSWYAYFHSVNTHSSENKNEPKLVKKCLFKSLPRNTKKIPWISVSRIGRKLWCFKLTYFCKCSDKTLWPQQDLNCLFDQAIPKNI